MRNFRTSIVILVLTPLLFSFPSGCIRQSKNLVNAPNKILFTAKKKTAIKDVDDKTDLYQYDVSSKKVINLTENLNDLISYELSPNQKSLAFLTKDRKKNIFKISIMDLTSPSHLTTIQSFPCANTKTDYFSKFLYTYTFRVSIADDASFYSFFWSKDSQYLFFTSTIPWVFNEFDNDFNFPVFNRVKVSSGNLLRLTTPDEPMFHPSLSPDGKKIVYLQGVNQFVFTMNTSGTGKKVINLHDPIGIYFKPTWSPDSKKIAYYFQREKDEMFYFIIYSETGTQKKTLRLSSENLLPVLCSSSIFSPNGRDACFIQNMDIEENIYFVSFLEDLKKEIQLQGMIKSFRWSPSGNCLLLLESKLMNQINQLKVRDSKTKTYMPISKDVSQIFDACWSPDGKQILYSGTDNKTGQIVFKTSQSDGSNQKVLITFGENPLEQPSSIEKIEKLVWLK